MKLLKKYWLPLFLLIVSIGMLLRFYRINDIQSFGWDQGRDAWLTRDIIQGKWVLNGPRTGVGHFHLGPLWYYLLVPFYLMTGLDPVAANYLNFIVNLFNFAAIYWVTKKILDDRAALFVTFFYATNRYLIELNRVAWNVSPVTGVAALIFYCLYRIVYDNKYKYIYLLSFLSGIFFHLHFSVVFLPFIILSSFILVKDKLKVLKTSLLSLPLALVWLIPEVVYELNTKNTNINLFSNFLKDYFIDGFHLRFFLYRLYDGFIQFETMLSLPKINRYLVLIVPLLYVALLLFDKNRKQRILGYLTMLWFLVPAVGYSFYAGSTSEYYMLMSSMLVIYIIYYIFNRLFSHKLKFLVVLPVAAFLMFTYSQVKTVTGKRIEGGLNKQKSELRDKIKNNNKVGYNEGDIQAYLWQIWVEDKK
jgi:4-amino-4-deoxy-L-arabinose transferase-like glycosyltransferase